VHILVGLGDETMHGYGIMLAIEEMTGGQVQMAPGTLYTTIKKLLVAGLIEEVEAGVGQSDERRRYYRTTGHGLAFVRAELGRLDHLVRRGRRTGLLADR
jgi:DNA-binding PadR family transcriptional regulator